MIPLSAVRRLMKEAEVERSTNDAVLTMTEILEEITIHIVDRACQLAKHAGRKTVKKEDIQLAKIELFG
jgi:histone H3/H4